MTDNSIKIILEAVDKTKGAFDELQKAIKGTEENTKKMAETNLTLGKSGSVIEEIKTNWLALASKIGIVIGAFYTAKKSVEGFSAAVKAAAANADEIGKSAEVIGITTTEFQRLAFVAKMADVDIEEFNLGLKLLSRNMEDAAQGTGQAKKWFDVMGISVKDASNNLKPLDVIMGEVADKFAGWADGPRKIAIALDLFGRSGERMIPLLNQGKVGFENWMQKAEELGGILSPELVGKGTEIMASFKKMDTALQALKTAFFITLAPIGNFGDKVGEATKKIIEFVSNPNVQAMIKLLSFLTPLGSLQHFGIFSGGEYDKEKVRGEFSGEKKVPLPAPPPAPRLKQEAEAEITLIALLQNQLGIEKEIAGLNQDWERTNELHQIEIELLDEALQSKIKQILANDNLTASEKTRAIIYERGLADSQKDLAILKRKDEIFDELLKKNKSYFEELQRDITKEMQVPALATVGEPFELILPKAEEWSLFKQAQEALFGFGENLENAKKTIAEITGDFRGLKDAEIALLEIEKQRVFAMEGIDDAAKKVLIKAIELKQAEAEARKSMDVGALINMGAAKGQVEANNQVADQFYNLLPNSVGVFVDSIKNCGNTFKGFFQNLETGFLKLVQDIMFAIIKMEILQSLGKLPTEGGGGTGILGWIGSALGIGGSKGTGIDWQLGGTGGWGFGFKEGGIVPSWKPIAAFQEGGIAYGSQLGVIGEGGPEAFVPLKGGKIPVQMMDKGREAGAVILNQTTHYHSWYLQDGQTARDFIMRNKDAHLEIIKIDADSANGIMRKIIKRLR